jgi:hypothetical protein
MYCTHRRPLNAVRAILHTVRFVTVMVMVAGAFGMFEMFGGVVRASEHVAEGATGTCSAEGGERRRLRVRLVPAKYVSAEIYEIAQQEVLDLWQPYGVDVVWEGEWKEGDTGQKPDLFVFFVDRELKGRVTRGATAVAWILFIDGSPRELINVSIAAARRLLDSTTWLDERPVRMAPLNIQDQLVGRMVGRALAHEIGHYLLASSKHAGEGLMKPLITPAEFVKGGRNHLKLVPDDVRALRTARLAGCQLTASNATGQQD